MKSGVPKKECEHCLPDCTRVIYQPKLSTQPFRICDEKNLGMSDLCNMENPGSIQYPNIRLVDLLKMSILMFAT